MKISKRTTLLFIITSFLLVFFSGFCFADRELELVYPELVGIPDVKTPTVATTILTDFVKYVFTLFISIAGLLAFGALIYGGFRYLTSAGDPSKMGDGKDQVMAGLFGLIILLSSYLILNTIDPRFVMTETPNLESLEQGIYAYVKTGCVDDPEDSFDDPVPITQSSPDLSVKLPRNASGNPQYLQCIKFRSSKEELTVWAYSDKATKSDGGWFFAGTPTKYEGNSGETVDVIGQPEAIKLDYYLPGVYLFAEEGCTGEVNLYQSSSATLPEFDNKTQSIKFIYGDKNDISGEYETKYAAILHQNENFMGGCLLVEPTVNRECISLSGSSVKKSSPLNNFSFEESNAFAAGVCDTTIDGHDGNWWCNGKKTLTGLCNEVERCLDDDTMIHFGCGMIGMFCSCNSNDSYTEDCDTGEKCLEGESWDAQCAEGGEGDGEEDLSTTLTPPFTGVSSITVYLKGEPTGEGVRFWGDKGYTNLKDTSVLPLEDESPYGDDSKLSDLGDDNDKITSMKMQGPYVALLFDGINYSGECEVFMSSCPDFRSYRIGQCGFLSRGDCLSSFIIKARK